MEPNFNDLQSKVDANGKKMVDNQETSVCDLSRSTGRSVRGLDWTSILRKANLESPGYHETVEKMKKDGRLGKSL